MPVGSARAARRGRLPVAIPDSVVWETNTDWSTAPRDANINVSNDTFTLDSDSSDGYLTTNAKPDDLSLSFELYDHFNDGRWETPRIGGYDLFRPEWRPGSPFSNEGEGGKTISNGDTLEIESGSGIGTGYGGPAEGLRWTIRFRNTQAFDPQQHEGGWDWWFLDDAAGTSEDAWLIWNDADSNDRLGLKVLDATANETRRYPLADSISDDNWHVIEVERDNSGIWTFALDGTELGTVDDGYIPDYSESTVYVDGGNPAPVQYDYLEVEGL